MRKLVFKRNCGSSSGRDFSIRVQPILKRFTVFESAFQAASFPRPPTYCNVLDIFLIDPKNGAQVGLPSSAVVIFRFSVGVDKFPIQISAKWLKINGKTRPLFPLCVAAYARHVVNS